MKPQDEEIKKSLEEFQNRILKTNLSYHIFESEMMAVANALDLISRQQAENERLKSLCISKDVIIKDQQAEIEQLQKKYDKAMDNLKAVLKERAGEQDV